MKTFSLFCLVLATAVALPAQDDQPNAVRFKVLVNFDGTNGSGPSSPLVQGTDGNLYGTTAGGGANGYGTVFKVTPTGTLTTLYSFCAQADCADGSSPNSLILARDGNFYGTTSLNGW